MVVDGCPVPVRARSVARTSDGYTLLLPAGVDPVAGPVCLTFHRFGGRMKWQENVILVGEGRPDGGALTVTVDRALNDRLMRRGAARRFERPGPHRSR